MAGPNKPGPKKGFMMGAAHREKIKNSNILRTLIKHAEGQLPELSATQVQAGLGLLKKVLPDLSSVQLEAGNDTIDALATLLNGIAEAPKRIHDSTDPDQPTAVH